MGLSLKHKSLPERKFTARTLTKEFYYKLRQEYGEGEEMKLGGDTGFISNIKVGELGLTATIVSRIVAEDCREFALYVHEWRGEERYENDYELPLDEKKCMLSLRTSIYNSKNNPSYNGLMYGGVPLDTKIELVLHPGMYPLQLDGNSKYLELLRFINWEYEKFRRKIFED